MRSYMLSKTAENPPFLIPDDKLVNAFFFKKVKIVNTGRFTKDQN